MIEFACNNNRKINKGVMERYQEFELVDTFDEIYQ